MLSSRARRLAAALESEGICSRSLRPLRRERPAHGRAWSWRSPLAPGIELFRAVGIDHRFGRHFHEAYALGAFEAGVGTSDYRGARHRFGAGDVVAMDPGEPHTGAADGGEPMTYRMLYVEEEALGRLLPEGTPLPRFREVRVRDRAAWRALLGLHTALAAPVTGAEDLEIEWRLARVLKGFAARFARAPQREPAPVPERVARMRELLSEDLGAPLTVADLAGAVGLSRAHAIRAFHRAVGLPPHAWRLQARVQEAKRRLARGIPIAAVAQALGFADQAHLTRCFRSLTGTTPGAYRRACS